MCLGNIPQRTYLDELAQSTLSKNSVDDLSHFHFFSRRFQLSYPGFPALKSHYQNINSHCSTVHWTEP